MNELDLDLDNMTVAERRDAIKRLETRHREVEQEEADLDRALAKAHAYRSKLTLPPLVTAMGATTRVEVAVRGKPEDYEYQWEIVGAGQLTKVTKEPIVYLETALLAPGEYTLAVTAIPRSPAKMAPGVKVLSGVPASGSPSKAPPPVAPPPAVNLDQAQAMSAGKGPTGGDIETVEEVIDDSREEIVATDETIVVERSVQRSAGAISKPRVRKPRAKQPGMPG